MCNYVVKQCICVLSILYCSERFINVKRFEKWDSCSRCQVLELSLETKGSEYTSVFPLIFEFLDFSLMFKDTSIIARESCSNQRGF